MGFKIEKQATAEPEYCGYVQEKVDIARENGAVYELVDEDYRIQALYDQKDLITKDKINVINRVRSKDDGKEYIVINKLVDFYTPDPENPKKAGVYKDRYATREGIVELPLKSTNPETGEVETKQTQLVYTIPFTASKVDEYLDKCEEQGTIPQLTFYEGAVTSNRLPVTLPTVGNAEYFKEANWTELLLGKEKKLINSMVNRLPEVRKEFKKESDTTTTTTNNKKESEKPTESSSTTKESSPKEEVNKQEKDNENSDIGSFTSGGGTGGGGGKTTTQQQQQQSKFGSSSSSGGSSKKN